MYNDLDRGPLHKLQADSGFFGQILGKQEFLQTSLHCYCDVFIYPKLHAKYQKNVTYQSRENHASMENGSISGMFGQIFGQTRIFPN